MHQSHQEKSEIPFLNSKLSLFLLICVPLQNVSLGQARVDFNEPADPELLPTLRKSLT